MPTQDSAETTRNDLRRATLDAMLDSRTRQDRAAADRFLLAAEFADLYRELDEDSPVALHGERLVVLGGDGCPEVAEFATMEMATRLGMRPEHAAAWMSSALNVRHRLPDVWRQVGLLQVPVWLAQKLASATIDLPLHECLAVSRELAALVGRMSPTALVDMAKAKVLERRPVEATHERQRELALRTVRLWQGDHTTGVEATLDKADGLFLDAQLNRIAGILADAGDTDDHDVRRAKALGVLAAPARALQMLQAALLDQLPHVGEPDAWDSTCPAAGHRGHTCGSVTVDPAALLPKAELVVQLTDATVRDRDGLANAGPFGPVLAEWVADLLGHTRVTVRPVLDVGALSPSSAYHVPPRMRESVMLRNPTSVFPHSTRSSRHLDQDHTVPFDPLGPLGQTRPDNLGPLGRREHRAKTHGGWQVDQPSPGVYLWRSPLGYRYLVTPSATLPLDPPPQVAVPAPSFATAA